MPEQLGEAVEKVKRQRPGSDKDSIAKKVLVPLAASAASAATAYVVKKAPDVFREKVLPKIRENGGFESLAQDLLERLREVADSVAHVELPGMHDGRSTSAGGGGSPPRRTMSDAQRERERKERAARRRARRQASSS